MNYELHNEDCFEALKRIPDGSVDMILDDIPYGATACYFDKRLPLEPMWEQFKRVTKHNAEINTGRKFIGFELEKKFYDIAEKRISEALAIKQQELFHLEGDNATARELYADTI